MKELVYQFHETGDWLIKGEHTLESAVEFLNSYVKQNEDGWWEPITDIGDTDGGSRPYEISDFRSHESRWWRWIPAPRGDDDHSYYLHAAEPHTRGAFVASYLSI